MCANIGVDPLASNKGLWTQVLNIGDFYYELGIQVVEACLATRSINGGLIDLNTLAAYVKVHVPSFLVLLPGQHACKSVCNDVPRC